MTMKVRERPQPMVTGAEVAEGSVTVIGAGRLGLSLAVEMSAKDLFRRVRVVGHGGAPDFLARHPEVDYRQAEGTGSLAQTLETNDAPHCLVFCVPDDVLPAAAAAWSTSLLEEKREIEVALHTSGFHEAEVLADLRRVGAVLGNWHPMVALAEPGQGVFEGVSVGLEGDEAAVALGERIARGLETRILRVRPGGKAHYHAAAVFASNYLLACLSVATRELDVSCEGVSGMDHLLPLAHSALEAVAQMGLAAGVTGPLARGDAETVAGHLAALDPRAASLYRALAKELLDLLGARLDEETVRALRSAMGL